MRCLIVALTLVSVSITLAAQQIVSMSGLDIVGVDPVTGSVTVLGRPATHPSHIGVSSFDFVGRRLFYFGANPPASVTDRLVTFNLSTGIASEVIVPGVLPYFAEYDPASGRVLAPSGPNVISIEPTTGATAIVGPLPLPVSQGESTYDPVGRRLFYLGLNRSDPSTPRLATVDVAAGTGSQVPVPGVFGFIEFDPATGRVLASRPPQLVSIDPATGASSVIGILSLNPHLGSTFDPANRRLFYLGTNSSDTQLVMFDLGMGSSRQLLAPGLFVFAEYDAVHNAVHEAVPALQSFVLILLLVILVTNGLSAMATSN